MSWNKAKRPEATRADGRWRGPRRLARGILAGCVVVATGTAAIWFLRGGGEDAKAPARGGGSGSLIKAVDPAPQPAPKGEAQAPEKAPKPLKPQRVGEIRDGKVLLVDGRLRKVSKHVVTAEVARVTVADRTFDEPTDRLLAHLLEIEPGEALVGDSADLYRGFDREFVKSLSTQIVYDKNDDQYVKELKVGVLAMREELKRRMDAGEDINKVLAETRDQMQELGAYRQEIENMVVEMTQEKELTQETYDDIVKAANKMLEERGSKPLELPAAVRHRFRIYGAKKESNNSNKE